MATTTREKEPRDSIGILLLILLFGFLCIILASGWALRFAPRWKLNANMESKLDPNSEFVNGQSVNNYRMPLDPNILTRPAWLNIFLTPNAVFSTGTPPPTKTTTALPTFTLIPTDTLMPSSTPPLPTVSSPLPIFTVTQKPTSPLPPPPILPATVTTTATTTVTPAPILADLQITNTDNITEYASGISIKYVIVVSNAGPNGVTGATVTDTFPAELTGITWTCSGSGSCAAVGSGNILDTVNLPVGASVTYTVSATVIAVPAGSPLVTTAVVAVPAGMTDPIPGNNQATDLDAFAYSLPYQNIGLSPDGLTTTITAGSFSDFQFVAPLVVGAGKYIVYYLPPSLQIDAVILQIGNGQNWYTVFNWGNGSADINTNVQVPLPMPPNPTDCAGEPDACAVALAQLTNPPGITIFVDGMAPNGNYPYLRILSPAGDTNGGVNIDAIQVLP